MNYYTKNTPVGDITITEEYGFITSLIFGDSDNKNCFLRFSIGANNFQSKIIGQAFKQLEEYFSGVRKNFDLPLNPKGTKFQQKVWSALLTIPYGETRCYKDIAVQIGNSNASRAVGMANHENRIPIFIPCHRVISANGTIGGYSDGMAIKTKLLHIEHINI